MCADNLTTPYGHRVVIGQRAVHDDLVAPFSGEEYVCLVWAADNTFDEAARMRIVGALIDSGCRYVVCGGVDCEQWHDDADVAFSKLEVCSNADVPFVMTTWHHNESIEDVVFFATCCTNFDGHDFKCLLVLVVGQESARLGCLARISRGFVLQQAHKMGSAQEFDGPASGKGSGR